MTRIACLYLYLLCSPISAVAQQTQFAEVVAVDTESAINSLNRERAGKSSVERIKKDASRVYVSYDGRLYSLQGFAKVPLRDADGNLEREPLSPQEEQIVSQRLFILNTALRLQRQAVQPLQAKLEEKKENFRFESANQPKIDTHYADIQGLESQIALLDHTFAMDHPNIWNDIRTLDDLLANGKPVLSIVRTDNVSTTRTLVRNEDGVVGIADADDSSQQEVKADAATAIYKGRRYRRPQFLLPAPHDPNDLFYSPMLRDTDTRMGMALALEDTALNLAAPEDWYSKVRATPSFAAYYDTRTMANTFNVANVTTSRRATDGNTTFLGNAFNTVDLVPTTLAIDNQSPNMVIPLADEESQVQLYAEATNFRSVTQLDVRHLYVRVWNKGSLSIAAGKTWSMFSSNEISPTSLGAPNTLIGTAGVGGKSRNQFRLQREFTEKGLKSWGWGLGIEEGQTAGFTSGTATALTRWPAVAGYVGIRGKEKLNQVQFTSLIRHFGAELPTGEEIFDTGWGIGLYSSALLYGCDDYRVASFAGVAGGSGLGNYLNGATIAALIQDSRIRTNAALGAYVGCKYLKTSQDGWQISSDIAYGYLSQEVEPAMAATENTHLHHFWANLFLKPNENVAVGCEWQYGRRLTNGAGNGENSRFFVGIHLTTSPGKSIVRNLVQTTEKIVDGVSYAERHVATDRELFNASELRSSKAHLQRL